MKIFFKKLKTFLRQVKISALGHLYGVKHDVRRPHYFDVNFLDFWDPITTLDDWNSWKLIAYFLKYHQKACPGINKYRLHIGITRLNFVLHKMWIEQSIKSNKLFRCCTVSSSQAALSSFQDCVGVLERSLQRQEMDSSMASSMRSSSSIRREERKDKH